MACSRGRAKPTASTKLRLFSDAAGYCNRPDCNRYLFIDEPEIGYHIAEMAHILAASDRGPRPDSTASDTYRASYDNLILLCPNCHTEIDKRPDLFPDELVRDWKLRHREIISGSIGIPVVTSRKKARAFLEPIFQTNGMVHSVYGPDNQYHENPESEQAVVWKAKVVEQIIPNSQKILLFLDKHPDLILEDERGVVEMYRQHVDDLIKRHIDSRNNITTRYPAGMDALFGDH